MKTKLVFSTEKEDFEHWFHLPMVPRLKEWVNVQDILKPEEILKIKESAFCWSSERGSIQSVEYRYDKKAYYVEVFIWCED